MMTCSSWRLSAGRRAAWGRVEEEPDPIPDQPVEEMGDIRQDRAQVERFRQHALLAGEGEELADEARGSIHVLPDLVEVREVLVAAPVPQEKQVGVAGDRQ
jgi:hypothetical protein